MDDAPKLVAEVAASVGIGESILDRSLRPAVEVETEQVRGERVEDGLIERIEVRDRIARHRIHARLLVAPLRARRAARLPDRDHGGRRLARLEGCFAEAEDWIGEARQTKLVLEVRPDAPESRRHAPFDLRDLAHDARSQAASSASAIARSHVSGISASGRILRAGTSLVP